VKITLTTLLLIYLTFPAFAGDVISPISEEMKTTVELLKQQAATDQRAYQLVESLTTEIGPRLAGSPAEAKARAWAVEKFQALGFKNIRIEEFAVPFWRRVTDKAEIIAPFPQALTITALGGSISTPAGGVESEVVAFSSMEALRAEPDDAHGNRILFIDEITERTKDGRGYGMGSQKRREAAYEAHRLGASAVLIRSVGTSSHRFPHTGQMHRVTDEFAPSVPAAALSVPDADQLARALSYGKPVVLRLVLETESGIEATSGNVIAEIPGRERPEEIVLIGAHLDSWDLGTGAVDDGAGVAIVMAAAKQLLDNLAQAPRRTIRVVLFGSEEPGLVGARAYARKYAGELGNHIVAAESDFGAAEIWKFDSRAGEQGLALVDAIADALKPMDISYGSNEAWGGPDLKYIREAGVPVVSLTQNGWDYFDLHHTPDDTLDKIDPDKLAQNVAAYVVFTYLAAESEANFR